MLRISDILGLAVSVTAFSLVSSFGDVTSEPINFERVNPLFSVDDELCTVQGESVTVVRVHPQIQTENVYDVQMGTAGKVFVLSERLLRRCNG